MFSLTTPKKIEEILYEGPLEPRSKSNNTRGESPETRLVDEQSRPYVQIGVPQWYDIAEWYQQEGKTLPAVIAKQRHNTSFFLVQFSCSLRSNEQAHIPITWARFDAELSSVHETTSPIALDLHPRYVKKEQMTNVHIALLPSLQFKEAGHLSLDERILDVSYTEIFPTIVADGVNASYFGWEMIATHHYPLEGIRSFHALLKVPRQAHGVQTALKLVTEVTTYIGPRRMGLSIGGPKKLHSLSYLICAPDPYPSLLQVPVTSPYCQIVIFTAQATEYEAVRSYLVDIEEVIHPDGAIYERGKFIFGQRFWNIGIVETGKGNTLTAVATERAIRYFKPTKVLFVGIAGGLKDVKVGDVVASTKVYGYEAGKDEGTFRLRPNVLNATYRMVERARAEARKNDWIQRGKASHSELVPKAYVAPIAAGEKIVAATRSATRKFLQINYGDALAVEMEGYGFLEAISLNPALEAIIIRGISNLIDDQMYVEIRHQQEMAAQHASAFAFELLTKLEET